MLSLFPKTLLLAYALPYSSFEILSPKASQAPLQASDLFPFTFPLPYLFISHFSATITSAMEQVLEVLRCSHVRVIHKPNRMVPLWPSLNLR